MRTTIFTFLLALLLIVAAPANSALTAATKAGDDKSLGLTLSGGGARGLAHVGVLHVLDSLGIEVDYVTGTSMGSIVGGMYAAGYTAREIEDFALNMNWEAMFARSAELSYIHPLWRDDHGQYILELPLEDWSIRLSTGAIEGQQMWNTLNEIFFHVHTISDFDELTIPFACVATNVEDGLPVVMRDGNLVTAIRASMAMPSIFTVVERNDLLLIDGGVANNFPVIEAKEMGADYVIGINVSQGLRPAEELISPIDIIYQMGSYSDARSFARNREATDLFIEPDLTGYTAASFASTRELIERGKKIARNNVEELLALDTLYGKEQYEPEPIQKDVEVVIDSLHFLGLKEVRPWFVRNTMGIYPGDTLNSRQLTNAVNRLYATNYFDRVHYQLEPCKTTNKSILILEIKERPITNLSGSLHFSRFAGVSIQSRLSTNRLFHYNAQASVSVLLGEQPAFQTNLTFFTKDNRRQWLQLDAKGRQLTFPLYVNFNAISEYRQQYLRSQLSYNIMPGEDNYFSFGAAFYRQGLKPNMQSRINIEGYTQAFEGSIGYKYHTLNSNTFPTKGQRIHIESIFFFNQKTSFSTLEVDFEEASLEDLDIELGNFVQGKIKWDTYVPIAENLTQISRFQFGYNFAYQQGFINNFNIGGTHAFLENQITFSGLEEYELLSESVIMAGLGYQYHLGRNLYTSLLGNAAMYDFRIVEPENIGSDNFIFGGSASFGYDSLIGPFELTFSYSLQTNNFIGYINLGWAF